MKKGTQVLWGFALIIGISFILASCSKPSCKKLYSMLNKCEKDFPLKEDKFIEMCEKEKDKNEEAKEMIECSAKSDCDEFKKCQEEIEKKRKAKRIQKDIEKLKTAVEKKDYKEAGITCDIRKDDMNDFPELKKMCEELPKKGVTDLTAQLTEVRDKGDVKDVFNLCYDLEKFAKKLSADEEKKAKTLCDEVRLVKRVKEAIDAADKNIKEKKDRVPYQCDGTIKDLEKLGTDWANKQVTAIAKKCYLDLGKIVLEAKVPKMKYTCAYDVQKVYEAVKKYDLKDAALDPLIEQSKELCEKKK